MPHASPLPLVISGLELDAPDGRALLRVPSLTLDAGQFTVVTGPSGAGKSTLLYALAGLLPIAGGEVCWGGTNMAALRDPQAAAFRARHMGFVFQDHLLMEELSAMGNAALGEAYLKPPLKTRAAGLLEKYGLNPAPGRRVSSYSGGERQRIAVARALAHDPAILLADEPTASLDRATADTLIEDLVALSRDEGRLVLCISHDPACHARADRLLHMRDGQLHGAIPEREGNPNDL